MNEKISGFNPQGHPSCPSPSAAECHRRGMFPSPERKDRQDPPPEPQSQEEETPKDS